MDKLKKYDAIVICSTLNQMVNYIPIMLHEIDTNNVYNIRMNTSSNKRIKNEFNYDNWNENLRKVLNCEFDYKEKDVTFNKNEILNYETIIKHIKDTLKDKIRGKKVLWNITGGQRYFTMAITKCVLSGDKRPDDTIMYYDGDREKIYYYSKNKSNTGCFDLISGKLNYKMTIPKALRLMGFCVKDRYDLEKPSEYYEKIINDVVTEEHKWYSEFLKLYCENVELRKLFINSNRFKNDKDINDKIIKTVLDKILKEVKESNLNDEIKYMFNKDKFETIKVSIDKYANGKVFGYILEKMTLYKLMDIINENDYKSIISDIDADIKVDSAVKPKNKNLDQFDVMLATKTGKIIMLECKSGGMDGDNAKSNNYSTYAIAGVYGNPIVVVPLSNRDDISKKVTYESKVYKTESYELELTKNNDLYQYIRQAINSAQRASIDVKLIDNLGATLKDYKDIEEE